MIDNASHSLTFGDLVWIEDGANPPDSSGIVYRVQPQDATFGTAVPVTTALLWLGRAGGPVSYDSTPNREPVFRVTVEADNSDLLARAEASLQLQCERPCELTWTPPDGAGEPSVFDIVWSHLEPVFERDGLIGVGMEETVLRSRTYLVRMQALPYARGKDLVVTLATAATPTFTSVDNGSALSGSGFAWSLNPLSVVTSNGGYTLSTTGGRIRLTNTPPASSFNKNIYRQGTVDLTPGGYLAVDIAVSNMTITSVVMDHLASPLVATQDLGSGVTRYFFDVSHYGSQISNSFMLTPTASVTTYASTAYLEIDQVQVVDALPYIGTSRQRALSLTPGGSVRTNGSIQVAHDTDALGTTIVHTHPSGTGYLPPLSPWRISGPSRTSDSTLVSGARNAAGATSTIFEIPVTNLPTGRAEIWARMRATSALDQNVYWAVVSKMGSNVLDTITLPTAVHFDTVNVWQLVNVGSAIMPPIALGPAGTVQIHLQTSDNTVQLDEAYLFATDQGSLTIVDCGTGTLAAGGPSNRLWIDAPSLEQPMGAIYRGNAADRSDQWHAGSAGISEVWGEHGFDPAGTSVFVATAGATDAATSLTHYRRFNTFVARED